MIVADGHDMVGRRLNTYQCRTCWVVGQLTGLEASQDIYKLIESRKVER